MAKRVPKSYTVTQALTANQITEASIGLGGRDFFCEKITGYCSDTTNGGFKLNVTPSDTSNSLFAARIRALAIFGALTDPKPFRIDGGPHDRPESDYPLRVTGSSTITISLQDVAGGANTVEVQLHGYELIR